MTVERSDAPGGWTYAVWPDSITTFGTRARVTVDGGPIATSLMALGDGRHKLPLTGALLRRIGKDVGQTVTAHLT